MQDKKEYLVVSKKACPACRHLLPNMKKVARDKLKTLHVIDSSMQDLYNQAVKDLKITRVPSLFCINYTKQTVDMMPPGEGIGDFIN